MLHSKPTLAHQLHAFKLSLLQRLPAQEREQLAAATARLAQAVAARKLLQAGDRVTDFTLPDQHGAMVRLSGRLAHTPVVLLFVRGGWCPFCTLTLRAYQAWLPAIHDAGGDVLAVTPQPAGSCCQMAERDLLAFQTLSDRGNQVAEAFGIAFEVDPALRPMHLRLNHDLPRLNATGDWVLPLPSTFVIGQDQTVKLAHVSLAHDERLDPADVVSTLQALKADSSAA